MSTRHGSLAHSDRLGSLAGRRLALGAVAGPILFAVSWFTLGFMSPGYSIWGTWIAPYSLVSQPISGLGLGVTAPFMNSAFVVTGLLVMLGAFGTFQTIPELGTGARTSGAGLIALSGLGAIVCGVFDLEAFLPHFIGFVLAAGSPILSFIVVGVMLRGVPSWRGLGTKLLWGSALTLVLLIVYFANFDPAAAGAGRGIAGLIQRILILQIHGWIAALGWSAWRSPQTAAPRR